MAKQFALLKPKKETFTDIETVSNVSISTEIKEAIINKKDLFNDKPIEKSDLLITVDGVEPIYAESYYVSSAGDLVKICYIDGVRYVIVDSCDANIAKLEKLENTGYVFTPKVKTFAKIAKQTTPQSDLVDICEISLGNYTSKLKNNELLHNENYIFTKRTYRDKNTKQRKEADGPGTSYYHIFRCIPADFDRAKAFLKQLFNKLDIVNIDWEIN